jgi:hypothetical protein
MSTELQRLDPFGDSRLSSARVGQARKRTTSLKNQKSYRGSQSRNAPEEPC